jgi:hypothetical protein
MALLQGGPAAAAQARAHSAQPPQPCTHAAPAEAGAPCQVRLEGVLLEGRNAAVALDALDGASAASACI